VSAVQSREQEKLVAIICGARWSGSEPDSIPYVLNFFGSITYYHTTKPGDMCPCGQCPSCAGSSPPILVPSFPYHDGCECSTNHTICHYMVCGLCCLLPRTPYDVTM